MLDPVQSMCRYNHLDVSSRLDISVPVMVETNKMYLAVNVLDAMYIQTSSNITVMSTVSLKKFKLSTGFLFVFNRI